MNPPKQLIPSGDTEGIFVEPTRESEQLRLRLCHYQNERFALHNQKQGFAWLDPNTDDYQKSKGLGWEQFLNRASEKSVFLRNFVIIGRSEEQGDHKGRALQGQKHDFL